MKFIKCELVVIKKELVKYYQNFYQKKAVEFIGKYFYLLENKDFDHLSTSYF